MPKRLCVNRPSYKTMYFQRVQMHEDTINNASAELIKYEEKMKQLKDNLINSDYALIEANKQIQELRDKIYSLDLQNESTKNDADYYEQLFRNSKANEDRLRDIIRNLSRNLGEVLSKS